MNILDALKQARECLHGVATGKYNGNAADCAESLTAAIEMLQGQEPVAWIVPEFGFLFPTKEAAVRYLSNIESNDSPTPLYTHPAPAIPVEWRCKKCGVDRLKEDCKGNRITCPMVATAYAAPQPPVEKHDCGEAGHDEGRCGNKSCLRSLKTATQPPAESDELCAAAQAVVERWNSPLWKDLPHTGEYIERLRKALG